jgi:hypothetical protein
MQKQMDRLFKIGLLVAAVFVLMALAGWAEPRHPVLLVIFWPGVVITDDWLQISFWQHPQASWYVSMGLNMLIYSGLIGLCLTVLKFFRSRRKSQS